MPLMLKLRYGLRGLIVAALVWFAAIPKKNSAATAKIKLRAMRRSPYSRVKEAAQASRFRRVRHRHSTPEHAKIKKRPLAAQRLFIPRRTVHTWDRHVVES